MKHSEIQIDIDNIDLQCDNGGELVTTLMSSFQFLAEFCSFVVLGEALGCPSCMLTEEDGKFSTVKNSK
jgi:hypothetical protein